MVRLRTVVSTAGAPAKALQEVPEGGGALGGPAYSFPIPHSSQESGGDGMGHPCFSLSSSTARSMWWKKQPLDRLGGPVEPAVGTQSDWLGLGGREGFPAR